MDKSQVSAQSCGDSSDCYPSLWTWSNSYDSVQFILWVGMFPEVSIIQSSSGIYQGDL